MNAVIVIIAVIISAISFTAGFSYFRKKFPRLIESMCELPPQGDDTLFAMLLCMGAMLGLFPGLFIITKELVWLEWLVAPISALFAPLVALAGLTYYLLWMAFADCLSAFHAWCTRLAGAGDRGKGKPQ
jgi:hypothetical protein